MDINSFFYMVYFIYLERRWNHWRDPVTGEIVKGQKSDLVGELHYHNISAMGIEGVDGRKLSAPTAISSDGSPVSRGDIGCVLSHLKVVKKAKELGYKNYLVLEADVEFADDLQEKFSKYIKQVPEDWDMLYLGGSHPPAKTRAFLDFVVSLTNRSAHSPETHAVRPG